MGKKNIQIMMIQCFSFASENYREANPIFINIPPISITVNLLIL